MTIDQLSKRATAWTLNEALAQLRQNPQDPYLQYFVLVLAQREGKLDDVMSQLPLARIGNTSDLMSIFGGHAAVQECMQLNEMLPDEMRSKFAPTTPRDNEPSQQRASQAAEPQNKGISVSELSGPTVASHPWPEMLNGHHVEVSRLSRMIPSEFYLVESHSPRKFLDAIIAGASCQKYISQQIQGTAIDSKLVESIQHQLLLEGGQLERLLSDQPEEICVTGSDLYIRDGSDVTVIVASSEKFTADLLNTLPLQVESIRDENLVRNEFDFCQTRCISFVNKDRSICVFAANPSSGIHVRSNSRDAFERILETMGSKNAQTLGSTEEFAFVRNSMIWSKEHEDLFIYFSDPFIRKLVGPELRIKHRRRRICTGYLHMLDAGSLLYCAQECNQPQSIGQLRSSGCLTLRDDQMSCPDGGTYILRSGQSIASAECSFHGTSALMKPCIEIEIETISDEEADAYQTFVQSYNQYWRTFFDPIGIRVQLIGDDATTEHASKTMGRETADTKGVSDDSPAGTAKISRSMIEYRIETMILPLMDNSIYTALAAATSGENGRLNQFVVPKSSILNLAAKLNKTAAEPAAASVSPFVAQALGDKWQRDFNRFVFEGLGDQISFSVCDGRPTFSLDIPQLMGFAAATGTANGARALGNSFWLAGLVASLQNPVYLAVLVENRELVDEFLKRAIGTSLPMVDYTQLVHDPNRATFELALLVGPAKFRLYIERIGNTLYLASQPQILDELYGMHRDENGDIVQNDRELLGLSGMPEAQATLSLLPRHWNLTRREALLSWQDNARKACMKNHGYLATYARALNAVQSNKTSDSLCGELHDALSSNIDYRICPCLGYYRFDASTQTIECTVHGTISTPKQPMPGCETKPQIQPSKQHSNSESTESSTDLSTESSTDLSTESSTDPSTESSKDPSTEHSPEDATPLAGLDSICASLCFLKEGLKAQLSVRRR